MHTPFLGYLIKKLAVGGLLLVFLACFPEISAAQFLRNRTEIFGGYSYLRLDSPSYGFLNYSNLDGANIDINLRLYHDLSVDLDSSAHFGSRERFYTFMAGPQYKYQALKGTFFAHALFGKARNDENIPVPTTQFTSGVLPSSLGRAIAFGGGYDYRLTDRFTFRVIQGDYLRTDTYGATQSNIRLSTGIVYRFAKKGKK